MMRLFSDHECERDFLFFVELWYAEWADLRGWGGGSLEV